MHTFGATFFMMPYIIYFKQNSYIRYTRVIYTKPRTPLARINQPPPSNTITNYLHSHVLMDLVATYVLINL